jgi:hypothetical protein
MSDYASKLKWPLSQFWLGHNFNDNIRSQLARERQVVELISLGAPLPEILNKLCTLIDVQIGNVVSLILLEGAEESHAYPIIYSALQVGLNVFSSTGIFSSDKILLGVLEIYGCDSRDFTADEKRLIERVAYLAAIALQRREVDQNFDRPLRRLRSGAPVSFEKPPYIN